MLPIAPLPAIATDPCSPPASPLTGVETAIAWIAPRVPRATCQRKVRSLARRRAMFRVTLSPSPPSASGMAASSSVHTIATLSRPPLMSRRESGVKASARTSPVCPGRSSRRIGSASSRPLAAAAGAAASGAAAAAEWNAARQTSRKTHDAFVGMRLRDMAGRSLRRG